MRFLISKTYKIISVFLVVVVFISTTGFTLHKHICSCNNENVYTFFPELFGLKKSCCCAEIKKAEEVQSRYKQLLSNRGCCKNVFLFYKLPSLNVTVNNVIQKFSFLVIPFIYNENALMSTTQVNELSYFLYRPPPLTLYGLSFIHFIHCLKIPLPEIA